MDTNNEVTIHLIGKVTPSLPKGTATVRDVLRVYYFYRLVLMKERKLCINNLAKDLQAHYLEDGIATIAPKDMCPKLNKAIAEHELHKKSMYRESKTQRRNEQKFIDLLGKCFDVFPKINYHHNKTAKLNLETQKTLEPESNEVQQVEVNLKTDADDAVCEEFDDDNEAKTDFDNNNDVDFEMTLSKYQRCQLTGESASNRTGVIQKIIDSPDMSSALDRTGVSPPSFTLLCGVMAGIIGENVNECTLSNATNYRRRKTHRKQIVTIIKDDYISTTKSSLVLHWDGKKLPDTTNENLALRKKKVERLAIVVSGVDGQKIITIAKTHDGTGVVTSDTVFEHVVEWKLLESIVAVCTDTTAANTGTSKGSVVLFQQLASRNIMYFTCRHHVDELTIGGVFTGLFGDTSGPSPDMLEQFKNDWHQIDQTSFKPLDTKIFTTNKYMSSLRDDVISYIEMILSTKGQKCELKGDHLEMLQLCLMVLGKPLVNYKFHIPHACSHARWMAKIIYSMKMFLFRQQLNLSKTEATNLKNISLFICLIYVKHWMQCCVASNAPFNDLLFMKELQRYSAINKRISKLEIDKFKEHLWYLGSELVILSLFSEKVTDHVKQRMFDKMQTLDSGEWTTRHWRLLDSSEIFDKELDDFVDSSSMSVLKSLQIDIQFMFDNHAKEWKHLDNYKTAKTVVDSFQVINDCAERTLKLMTDVNESFTSNEPEMQRVIQVIEQNRKRIRSTKKSELSSYKKLSFK